MKKLFKYMGMYWKAVIAILAVLIIQAYCDLSLPGYTSDIVNVGIQQGGIDESIPRAVTADDMEKLLLFVSSKDADTVKEAYQLKEKDTGYDYDGSVYVLKSKAAEDEAQVEKLSSILGSPMMLVSGFESGSDMTDQMEVSMKDKMKAMIEEQAQKQAKEQIDAQLKKIDEADVFELFGMIPEEQRSEVTKQIEDKFSDMPSTMIDQAAKVYIKDAYTRLNVDTDQLQNSYLLSTGAKMVGLAFLGMAASILVGFMASRVGATAGRDLRGKVFRKVVGFSNNEFDHFSTASLITRSTNDIQQIQMLLVMLLRLVLYAPIMAVGGIYKVFHTNVSMRSAGR